METNELSASEQKSWEVAWTLDQLKKSANSWSLAGNAGVSTELIRTEINRKTLKLNYFTQVATQSERIF